ncbi:MAG TPA: SpoIIE family protein phosphatase [Planctomycetaceae bacterium]|nr:SpoIIE family protein phosphatase [Planctomycetaceae bacterium]
MAVLMVVKGSCPGQLVELLGERMVMGRHPSCHIVLDNAAVSRNHAQILESHGTYYLEDLRSRNGTLLNGKKIQGRTEIRDGDEIRVCEVVLQFFQGLPPESDDVPVPTPMTLGRAPGGNERGGTISDTDVAELARSGPFSEKMIDESSSDSSSIITSLDLTNRGPRIAVRPEAKLRAVMEISQNLARALKTEELLPRILESLFKIFPLADRGFVVIKDAASGLLQVQSLRTRREEPLDSAPLSMTILREAIDKARAILSADAASDKRFSLSDSVSSLKIRSVMCAPLVAKAGEPLGAIQIDTRDTSTPFSEDDLEVLASVAAQAALALENAQLHTAALKQRDYERDLEFATQVQLGFLPNERPRLEGYEFFDFYEAAQRVGGDFFDYVPLPDGRLAITVGDVAGKGLPAALLMARIYSDARYELLAKPTPAESMTSLNASVCSSGLGHRFITLAFVVLDPKSHAITIVNAGHLPPLLRSRRGQVKPLGTDVSGLPLGIQPETIYGQTAVRIEPDDSVVLATDGVTEAMNSSNEIYGTPRLTAFLKKAPSQAAPLGEALVADVEAFCAGHTQRDDICLICFHRLAT